MRRMRSPGEASEDAMKMASRSDSKAKVAHKMNVAKMGMLRFRRKQVVSAGHLISMCTCHTLIL